MPRTAARFVPHTATCPECGNNYYKDEQWKSVCFPCYADAHPERYPNYRRGRRLPGPAPVDGIDYRTENAFLQHKVRELMVLAQLMKNRIDQLERQRTESPAFDADMLRRMIQLCHPDRHANSKASVIVTTYLNGLRNDKS